MWKLKLMSDTTLEASPEATVEAELHKAMAATKCHRCGCFQDTVRGLEGSNVLKISMSDLLDEACRLFEPKRYDCLGCETCWPAVASNAAAEIDPALAEANHCVTAEPCTRAGWPPLPGNYQVLRFQAPVAVCTLNSDALVTHLASISPPGMAIVGTLHTENLGIEHIIRNLLPNPNVRFLVVCGEDTRRTIGHLPGQSLISLMHEGLDDNGRIRGAPGKRPVIRNVSHKHVEIFRRRIEIIDLAGETEVESIAASIAETTARDPGPAVELRDEAIHIPVEQALESQQLVPDPAGYLIVYPDRLRRRLVLEHYANTGILTRVLEGTTPAALYGTAIETGLVSRLDHAAYLGRELERADAALRSGTEYVQDQASGKIEEESGRPTMSSCECLKSCH